VTSDLEFYLGQIPELRDQSPANLIDYFAIFLIANQKKEAIRAQDIEACFDQARITKYSNISSYLSRNSKSAKGKRQKYIRSISGFCLERHYQVELQASLFSEPGKKETSHLLRDLLARLKKDKERDFLQEAIDCYEIGATRASIVMVWILTMSHLQEYIFNRELAAFNTILGINTDKRIKITAITKLDDFSELPENKIIEFARNAKIITNDVYKILDIKLGIRNTSAHPSSVKISGVKATEFIIDLVENVIIKYL
jgi:hypothetical protein